MSKKIKMIFDATLLLGSFDEKSIDRGGIFFVSLNLIKEFSKHENIEIFLYSSDFDLYKKWSDLQKELIQDIGETEIRLIPFGIHEKFQTKIISLDLEKSIAKKNKKLIKTGALIFQIIFYKLLKKRSNSHNIDSFYKTINVYFSPIFKIPYFIDTYSNIEQYVITYDIIPIIFSKYYPGYDENSWLLQVINSMVPSKKYFTISESTKKDLLQFVPKLEDNNIIVSPLAAAQTFYPCPERSQDTLKKYGLSLDKKYIFTLCSLAPHKNLFRVIKTFVEFIKKNNIDDMVFILGGTHWDNFMPQLDKEISDLGNYKDKIIKAGYIDDEDLAPLYSGAQWFVYTSQYEGFGLPPLEAMSCGCPVITSNNSSLPEVVGDAGIMIDWDSNEQHIEAYEKYYFDDEYRKEMAQKGLERSKQFSWEKCADIMIEEFTK